VGAPPRHLGVRPVPVDTVELTVGGDPSGRTGDRGLEGTDYVIGAGPGADLGLCTATVTASDGVYATTLQFDILVSDTAQPPRETLYTPSPATPRLDIRRRSFLLHADATNPFPAP
jgi:hypothetical protein